MQVLEAHEQIAEAYAADPDALRAWLPDDCEPQHPDGVDVTVALLTAGASLSGCLDDAESLHDLKTGCEHFASLLSAGIVSPEQWNEEALKVIGELLAWGDNATMHERN